MVDRSVRRRRAESRDRADLSHTARHGSAARGARDATWCKSRPDGGDGAAEVARLACGELGADALKRYAMPSRMQIVHRLHRDEHHEVQLGTIFRIDQPEVQLVAACN